MSLNGGHGDNAYTIGEGNAARVSGGSGQGPRTRPGEGQVTDTLLSFSAGAATDTIVMDRQVGLDLNDYSGVENVENARGHVIGNDLNNRMVAEPGPSRRARGPGGNDTLIGNSGSSSLSGGPATTGSTGGQGDDVLEGGDGDDVLTGGENADILRGGAGNDTFFARDGERTRWRAAPAPTAPSATRSTSARASSRRSRDTRRGRFNARAGGAGGGAARPAGVRSRRATAASRTG
jgi:Ca2+-binding RTX toxin-like protein